MAIPEPSERDWAGEDGEGFLTDPEALRDRLPQPYRMVDRVLDRLLDRVWEAVLRREGPPLRRQTPLMLSAETQLPESTNCLACSGDGRFLAAGHAQGLSVSCASSLAWVSSRLEEGLEITAIQMTAVGQEAYLISTVDDMGVAGVFALSAGKIHLLQILNKTEDINQRSVCMTFELSEGGDFGAALMSCKAFHLCTDGFIQAGTLSRPHTQSIYSIYPNNQYILSGNGAVWLDIYHFPIEAWLEDLKQAASQSQMPADGDVRWTPCSVLMKITPAKIPTGTTLMSPLELLKKAEVGPGMGSGQNHMISGRQWKEQDAAFRSKYGYDPDQVDDRPWYNAVCLWWTGSHNLIQYSLRKAKNKQDVDPRPAMLWPNAQEIVCSAVSQSSRYIALGLEPDLVSVWDRQTGKLLIISLRKVFRVRLMMIMYSMY
ncbi:WD repeat-containing protein 93 [Merluccius polli]|uniref:WD repeat-containing protein 93 n=1 Tax=Merluccius polli TaxID=89951 RepID=A0AA47P6C4_MERPO|nr:WD repeat-containing protein 93 [Merluccius polli]